MTQDEPYSVTMTVDINKLQLATEEDIYQHVKYITKGEALKPNWKCVPCGIAGFGDRGNCPVCDGNTQEFEVEK